MENLRRARRAARADAVEPAFRGARTRIDSELDGRIEVTGEDTDAAFRDALAVAAVAPLRAPVAVDADVVAALGGPDAAFERFDAPLVIGCGRVITR